MKPEACCPEHFQVTIRIQASCHCLGSNGAEHTRPDAAPRRLRRLLSVSHYPKEAVHALHALITDRRFAHLLTCGEAWKHDIGWQLAHRGPLAREGEREGQHKERAVITGRGAHIQTDSHTTGYRASVSRVCKQPWRMMRGATDRQLDAHLLQLLG